MKSVRKLKRTVHKMIPHRWYRVIPWQKLRRMYKRRFMALRWLKDLFASDQSEYGPWMTLAMWLGPTAMYLGGIWLMVMAVADMAVRLIA